MKFYEGILARANERSWLAFRPLSPMAGSSADGVAKPIVAKRPLPEFKGRAATSGEDAEAAAWYSNLSKKLRRQIKGKIHMEGKAMIREDQFANVWRRAEMSEAAATDLLQSIQVLEAKTEAAVSPAAGEHPEPRFCAGQSVLQWWANWFKDEGPAPTRYGKKRRPTWFSGEVVSPAAFMKELPYAGMVYTGWVYPTH